MAALTVTPEALVFIRQTIERDQFQKPLVAIAWSRGQSDLSRGPNGEPVWVREPAGWLATVLDLAEVEDAGGPWPSPVVELHGYKFSLSAVALPPQFVGCTLGYDGAKLVVHETSI